MPKLSAPEPRHQEVRSDDGTLRIERSGERAICAELTGLIGLLHARALSEFCDTWIDVAPVNLSLFQDLSQVTAIDYPAQSHLAGWAREKALCLDRLHFVASDPRLIALIRAMFMALPVRAYLHKDRASFDGARERLG